MTVLSKPDFSAGLNDLTTPPLGTDHQLPKRSESSSPIKKRRIDFQRHIARYQEDEDYITKCTEQLQEALKDCTKDDPGLVCEEVEVSAKFARGYDSISNLTVGIMAGLEIRQRHFRQEPQHWMFKKRAKELLEESWKLTANSMLESLKRGLSCINCHEHHETGELFKIVGALGKELEGLVPETVDQKRLDEIKDKACRVGNEYLQQVEGTECRSGRKIWGTKGVDEEKKKTRQDSGVEADMHYMMRDVEKEE